ncbi:MAG: gamma-glutamylcyclotransferase [Arsenophonus sp. NC-QC1-MAG3]
MTYAQILEESILKDYKIYNLDYNLEVICGEVTIKCKIYRITLSMLIELDKLKNPQDYKRKLMSISYSKPWIYLYKLLVDALVELKLVFG